MSGSSTSKLAIVLNTVVTSVFTFTLLSYLRDSAKMNSNGNTSQQDDNTSPDSKGETDTTLSRAHSSAGTDVSDAHFGTTSPNCPPLISTIDLPDGMALAPCPDNQRYVYTRPSSDYKSIADGQLYAIDVIYGYSVLLEIELRSYHLSPIEKDIAKKILLNNSNKEISNDLMMSLSAVKYNVRNIYQKTKCKSRRSFTKLIRSGIALSTHKWRSRRDLEREMCNLSISFKKDNA